MGVFFAFIKNGINNSFNNRNNYENDTYDIHMKIKKIKNLNYKRGGTL